ncbi:MAG TPA: hypothetical protein VFU15_10775 [Bacteroidia bacterium]|nr:hypothetical protein [Bacteroidia bacterium]
MRLLPYVLPAVLLLCSCDRKIGVYKMENNADEISVRIPGDTTASVDVRASDDEGKLQIMIARYGRQRFLASLEAAGAELVAGEKTVAADKAITLIDLDKGEVKSSDYSEIRTAVQKLPEDTLNTAFGITTFLDYDHPGDLPATFSVKLHIKSPAGTKDTTLVFTRSSATIRAGRPY